VSEEKLLGVLNQMEDLLEDEVSEEEEYEDDYEEDDEEPSEVPDSTQLRALNMHEETSTATEVVEEEESEGTELGASGQIEALREFLEEKLGEDLLIKIYRYLRDRCSDTGVAEGMDKEIQDWLNKEMGPEKVQYARYVFRLIMHEDQVNEQNQ